MRIASQNNTNTVQQNLSPVQTPSQEVVKETKTVQPDIPTPTKSPSPSETPNQEQKVDAEKLTEAIDSLNEFLEINNKTSKFIKHEGLDKYFVRLVDTETDEVIKEIPPERLLNAFYEMQKLVGMIVDEKI